jgi:hypothetical protein
MTGRLHAWLRQAHSDKAVLLALDQEPERTHSIERLLSALELLGIETTPLRRGSARARHHPAKGAGGPADRPINEEVQVVLAMRSGECLG